MLSRLLQVDVDGAPQDLLVSVSAPVQTEAGDWFRRYTIGWPHRPRQAQGWGIDAIQALGISLQMIGAELYTSPAHAERRITWTQPGEGYGFPVPDILRDELIGSDRVARDR